MVIVGGGVVGASVAYHLAARGCREILVLERSAAPGAGSTGRATGGYRAQFGSEVNVRLSLLARDKLLRFREETGTDPGYRPCGYLFLAREPATLEVLARAREVQHGAGLRESRPVSPEEVRAINPALAPEGIVGGSYCPSDGFLRPLRLLEGYTAAARRLGVRFRHGEECLGIGVRGGRVATVRTRAGETAAGCVIIAAGAWAGVVGGLAGVEVPVRPVRRQVAVTAPFAGLPEEMPMSIFAEDGFHLRVRDGRVLLLQPDEPRTSDPFDVRVEPEWVARVAALARERVPCLARAAVEPHRCWAGLYESSPDGHALLGPAPEVEGLYLAAGSSGHGVMHAPALGQLLAEIVLDGAAHAMDVRALRPERFAEETPNTAPTLL